MATQLKSAGRASPRRVWGALVVGCTLLAACGSSSESAADAAMSLDNMTLDSAPGSRDLVADRVVVPDVADDATLLVEHLPIGSGMGISTLVVGPDGTSVLIDVGARGHQGVVAEGVKRRTGGNAVDWVILSHFHMDHMGAAEALFGPGGLLEVKKGIITRGRFDIDSDQNDDVALGGLCRLGSHEALKFYPLCEGPQQAPCGGAAGAPWPAESCDGLLRGRLDDPADDELKEASYIALGGGARLTLIAANTHVAVAPGVLAASEAGLRIGHGATSHENGRSVVGVIRWGDFRFISSGDLTQEMENFCAATSARIVASPGAEPLLMPGVADVVQLGHHGFASSSGRAWLDWLLPTDGATRNATIGAAPFYILPPEPSVLAAVSGRLGDGFIWITVPGLLGARHEKLKVANGAVVVEVRERGSRYRVFTQGAEPPMVPLEFTSTRPTP